MTSVAGVLQIHDVIITNELERRPSRPPDYEAENHALRTLSQALADEPDKVFQLIAETVMELLGADSAAIGLLEPEGRHRVLRWVASAGVLSQKLSGAMPCHADVFEQLIGRSETVLLRQAEPIFPELAGARPKICENLLASFRIRGEPAGLVWAIKHASTARFDLEDARVLKSLAQIGSAAGHVIAAKSNSWADNAVQERQDAAVRASDERLRTIFATAPVGLSVLDSQGNFLRVNDKICRILGRSREELLQLNALTVTFPADAPESLALLQRVFEKGEPGSVDKRYVAPDGTTIWASSSVSPLAGVAGNVDSVLVVTIDLTARRKAEQALRESEERLHSAIDVARMATWDWNIKSGELAWSDEHFRMGGYEVDEVTPSYEAWASRIHPDDRMETERKLREAMEGHFEYVQEFRSLHPDGAIRWLSGRGRFFYDDVGKPVRMIGAMIDVTDRRQWEDRQKVLIAELQHRTRNLLVVVRSIAAKTIRSSSDMADFEIRFQDRLAALARVQGLLSRLEDGDRVNFDALLRSELSAIAEDTSRISLSGPAGVRLRSTAVQTLAMAIHELATNALKYGSLSQPAGHLDVSWDLRAEEAGGQPWLHIDWRESGVVMPKAGPAVPGTGQGRELIERALPYQLGARTSYRLGPDGVRCTISIPVSTSNAAQGDLDG